MSDMPERPPIASSPLSVVLVARNAEADVADVLAGWFAVLDGLGRDYELLLIDDGSTDATAARAEALVAQQPRLKVLRHEERRGFGAALRTGITAARHPLLFWSTCDRQYQPEELKQLLNEIDKVDMVTGYRVSRPVPLPLRCLGFVYRLLVRVLFGVSLEPRHGWQPQTNEAATGLARRSSKPGLKRIRAAL